MDITSSGDGEFEVVTPRRRLLDDLPLVDRSDALCQLDWELHFESDGKILDLYELKYKIFKGGIEHEIRCEVWKFLLGYYCWSSTAEERTQVRTKKVLLYLIVFDSYSFREQIIYDPMILSRATNYMKHDIMF